VLDAVGVPVDPIVAVVVGVKSGITGVTAAVGATVVVGVGATVVVGVGEVLVVDGLGVLPLISALINPLTLGPLDVLVGLVLAGVVVSVVVLSVVVVVGCVID
jgi:hypothetical protein